MRVDQRSVCDVCSNVSRRLRESGDQSPKQKNIPSKTASENLEMTDSCMRCTPQQNSSDTTKMERFRNWKHKGFKQLPPSAACWIVCLPVLAVRSDLIESCVYVLCLINSHRHNLQTHHTNQTNNSQMTDVKSSPAGVNPNVLMPGMDYCYARIATAVDMGEMSEATKATLLAVDNENSVYAICGDHIRRRTVDGKLNAVLGSKGNLGSGQSHTSMVVDVYKHVWISSSAARTICKITSAGNAAQMDLRFLKERDSAGILFGSSYLGLTTDKEGAVYAFDSASTLRLIPYIPLSTFCSRPVPFPSRRIKLTTS